MNPIFRFTNGRAKLIEVYNSFTDPPKTIKKFL